MKRKMLIVVITLGLFLQLYAEHTLLSVSASTEEVSSNTKAIVIIPGILGSSLETTTGTHVWLDVFNFGLMALSEEGNSIYSICSVNYDNYGANDTYKTLYNSLYNAYHSEFDIIFFDYDFRLSNSAAALKLATELSDYDEVILVAHSMGGLVAGKFLANSYTNRAKTVALITLGTPFVGAAKCIDVMETGEMLTINLPFNFYVFVNTIRDLSKNCYAAYQLLPNDNYYNITNIYPVSVNGVNYCYALTQLQNTAWGRKSDNTVKPMFSTAALFHNSLYSSSTYVIDFSDVNAYTIAVTGEDTISIVYLNSDYEIVTFSYAGSGDGTVLQKSAGYGVPNYTYTGTDHINMVSDTTIINRIKTIITSETGVVASGVPLNPDASEIPVEYSTCSKEYAGDAFLLNERGWINGADNKRINVIADEGSVLFINGKPALEEYEYVYDADGVVKGHVWKIGASGRKMYALRDEIYDISGSGNITIEYTDDGYYEKIVDIDAGTEVVHINIEDHSKKVVSAVQEKDNEDGLLIVTWSESELEKLNNMN